LYLKSATLGDVQRIVAQRPIATLVSIPDGKAGTIATLKIMRQFARDAIRSPSQQIRNLALDIVSILPARSFGREVARLHAYVRDQIRYVRDPVDLESVATPEKTLEIGQGDCDDKSTLLAALLESTGHPARFVAVGFGGAPFSHVYTESKIGESWVPLETIIPRPMGWYPPNATSRYILKV